MPRAPRPPTQEEERRIGGIWRWGFFSDLYAQPQDPPPSEWEHVAFGIPRRSGGVLAALLFPRESPRGVVLFGHPGIGPGKGYFHRSNRIPFVRNLGFAAVTFDYGGFGESDGPTGLYHSEWEDVLGWARRRYPDVPIHVWGVSLGGYFAHHALSRDPGIESAIFEQVAPDLTRYGNYVWGRAGRLASRWVWRDFMRWFPAEAHAPFLHVQRALYVWGTRDHGIPSADSERLWRAAGPLASRHVVEGAGHLEAWKMGGGELRDAIRKALGA